MDQRSIGVRRRSLRLKHYDYSGPGGYFLTICTYRRENHFGEIRDGVMSLNSCGAIIRECFLAVPKHFGNTTVDEFVVMPNHIHGILILSDVGARHAVPSSPVACFGRPSAASLSSIVRSFKSASTKQINETRRSPGTPVWQTNYYEHVIRDERSRHRIREYIINNPARWEFDRENPAATAPEAINAWC